MTSTDDAPFVSRYTAKFPRDVAGLNKLFAVRHGKHDWPATLYRKSSKKIPVDHANRLFHPINFTPGELGNPAWCGPPPENKVARRDQEVKHMVARKTQTIVPLKLDGYWHYCYVNEHGLPEAVTTKDLRSHFSKHSDVLATLAKREGGFTHYDSADHELVDDFPCDGQHWYFPVDIRTIVEKMRPRTSRKKDGMDLVDDGGAVDAYVAEEDGGEGEEAMAAPPKKRNRRKRNAARQEEEGRGEKDARPATEMMEVEVLEQGTPDVAAPLPVVTKRLYNPTFPVSVMPLDEDSDSVAPAPVFSSSNTKNKPTNKKKKKKNFPEQEGEGDGATEKKTPRTQDATLAERKEGAKPREKPGTAMPVALRTAATKRKHEKKKGVAAIDTATKERTPTHRNPAGKTIQGQRKWPVAPGAEAAATLPASADWFDAWLQDKETSGELVVIPARNGAIEIVPPVVGNDTGLLVGIPAYRAGSLAPPPPHVDTDIPSMQEQLDNEGMLQIINALRAGGRTELSHADRARIEIARFVSACPERPLRQIVADHVRSRGLCVTPETAAEMIATIFAECAPQLEDATAFIQRCVIVNNAFVSFVSSVPATAHQ